MSWAMRRGVLAVAAVGFAIFASFLVTLNHNTYGAVGVLMMALLFLIGIAVSKTSDWKVVSAPPVQLCLFPTGFAQRTRFVPPVLAEPEGFGPLQLEAWKPSHQVSVQWYLSGVCRITIVRGSFAFWRMSPRLACCDFACDSPTRDEIVGRLGAWGVRMVCSG